MKIKKLTINILISFIKIYKFLLSPFFINKCRYLPSCSDYFVECLKVHGIIFGCLLGFKRILKCHPVKFLGGGSGLDLVPKKRKINHGQ